MKKILYLHGLESKQGGEKVGFLAGQAYVYAPAMDYREEDLHGKVHNMIMKFKPDLLIGSSMGGYVAHEFAKAFNLPAILLNPALHSRSFEPDLDTFILSYDTSFQEHQIVVLGKEDKVIDPKRTKEMLQGDNRFIIEEVEEMGHRTKLDIFINIYNKYKNG
mgnify:CR=1 FL=1|tara:strand:+ start:167 stop:652 length:486 start_codon:yes stop_codon:yes gene_type:complete